MKAPIILAVDTSDFETAISWIKATEDSVSVYKLGLEFYLNFGAAGVAQVVKRTGAEIFLDLKLHDIPHTVAGAANAIAQLNALNSGIEDFVSGKSIGNPFSSPRVSPRGLNMQFISLSSGQAPRFLLVSAETSQELCKKFIAFGNKTVYGGGTETRTRKPY